MKNRVLTLAALLAFILAVASVDAQVGKVSVKDVMSRLNKGPASLCPSIGKGLKTDAPNWGEVQRDSKVFLGLVEALTRNDPPRGDKASWDKLTRGYLESAKELDGAAQRKDKAAATAAQGKLANSANCNTCHKSHRG